MTHSGTKSAAPLDPGSTLEASAGSARAVSHLLSQPPALCQESQDPFGCWETIGGKPDFCDARDCLDPSYNLASEKLEDRGTDDVVIFCYHLDPGYLSCVEGDAPTGGDCPSLARFSAGDDKFFRVSKKELIESKQLNQITDPGKESQPIHSWVPWLGIM